MFVRSRALGHAAVSCSCPSRLGESKGGRGPCSAPLTNVEMWMRIGRVGMGKWEGWGKEVRVEGGEGKGKVIKSQYNNEAKV